MPRLVRYLLCFSLAVAFVPAILAAESNDQPGPIKPKVLWVYKSTEHFIAAPAVGEKLLYVTSIGAFNSGAVRALSLDPAAGEKERVVWTKTAPFLKLPTVSTPVLADGKIVFGDAMHQNDGGSLYCLSADSGATTWQLALPGSLIHLEGTPAIANGRVYMGGGNAGVFCVELDRVTLDGKELDAKTVAAELDKKRKALLAQYEADKKGPDAEFAIEPTDDALPKPVPKLVWKAGEGKWHVDAGVAVAGDRVFAATAFLDKEKQGERALVCLSAKDGSLAWKTPLKLNPWSGLIVADGTVLVGGSSVRLDPEILKGAKGEIVAVGATDGKVQWRKELPGGVVSAAAVHDKVAIFTATDGRVRCVWLVAGGEHEAGNDRWAYDAGAPIFAGATIAGDTVYVADLHGVVHALNLADGKKLWTLDLQADPAHIGGMIYGTPVVHAGRLYVATCSVSESEIGGERLPNAVVCIGE